MATVSNSARRFLVDCLRAFLAGEAAPQVETDGDALLELAAFHRVAPLLHRSLRGAGAQPPPSKLEAYVRSASNRGLLLTGELLRLLKRWDAAGVQAIPFKGPALASLLYGDPALRHFDDLDVLVRAEDFAAAKEVALALGYQPRERHSLHESFSLFRGGVEIVLELHWEFMPMPEVFPFAPHLADAWSRCETISLGGYKARAFAPADQLLYLCAHGSRHLWFRLQWICDVAQLLRTRPDLDWERLMVQARSSGGWRMLFLGLYLAHDLLGALLPPEIEQAVRNDRHTLKLANQITRRYFEAPLTVIKPWKETLFPLQLIDRPSDRLAYLPRLWFYQLFNRSHHSKTYKV